MENIEIPKSLYRIMPLYELIQMCEKPREFFLKSPRLWEDTYEGFFYKKLLTEDGLKAAYDFLINEISENKPDLTARNKNLNLSFNIFSKEEKTLLMILKCVIQYYLTFSVCFSKDVEESDAMWRIYSFDRTSIRVEFNREILSEIDYIHFEPVNYEDNLDFAKSLEKTIISNNGDITLKTFKPFIQKRKAFSHEKEIRMFYKHNLERIFIFNIEKHPNHSASEIKELQQDLKECIDDNKAILPSKFLLAINKYLTSFKEEDPAVSIDLDERKITINKLIKNILVHPQAPKFYVKIVKKYCQKYGIEFVKRSELYTFDKKTMER